MLLEAKNLGARYGKGPWLFRGLNFGIESGEIVGIVGPSGSGKTTFARTLAGYDTPVEGNVTINGSPVLKGSYHPVQLVFQHPEKAVNPRWKMKRVLDEAGTLDEKILAALGIEREWLSRWPNELSGGELQRFCVARALGANTRFLIADEMTTMLDAITQAQLWHTVLDIAKERGIGIVIISHDKNLINQLCTRVVDFFHLTTHDMMQKDH